MSNSKKAPSTTSDADKIIAFLAEHPLISRRGLCELVGYDVNNLRKVMAGQRQLPSVYLSKMARILRDYGYNR